MQLKSILNHVQRYKSFVYGKAQWVEDAARPTIEVRIEPRANGRAICSGCGRPGPGYDRLPERRFEFVPLWQIAVFRSVKYAVSWGLAHRDLSGIEAIGVDEIQWQRGHHYLTLVYQIEDGMKRLLWVARRLKKDGYEPVLKQSRWCLLKRPANLTEKQTVQLAELLQYNLQSVRSYLLREDFQRFWEYSSPGWAAKFLDQWCTRTLRSRIAPMKKVARSLREHRDLILNWFRARGKVSAGAVEGLNNKAKLTTRKA